MNSSLLFLSFLALLLLLLGALAIAAIYLSAHRCNWKTDNKKDEEPDSSVDPWQEAGRRQE